MFYIFNRENICVASCDFEPNLTDLESREEYCREFDTPINVGSILDSGNVVAPIVSSQTADYKQRARRLRDSIRDQIDIFVLPTSTISDELVTEEQKAVLVQDSLSLAKWPSLEGWPFVDLPELSTLTKSIIVIPEWTFPLNSPETNTEV